MLGDSAKQRVLETVEVTGKIESIEHQVQALSPGSLRSLVSGSWISTGRLGPPDRE